MSMVKIYGVPLSAPCRIVMMTCKVLGVQYELILTNPLLGETRTEEFLQLNPQHTIPVMVDGDVVINESRAAAQYLINKYGWDDCKLYPTDPGVRAKIDSRLYFDIGTFYRAFGDGYVPILFSGATEPDDNAKNRMHEVLGWVADFVKDTGYAAGTEELTLADISFIATFNTIAATNLFDLSPFKEVIRPWCKNCENAIPDYEEANRQGAIEFGDFIKNKIAENSG